jgi:hypothetical protein
MKTHLNITNEKISATVVIYFAMMLLASSFSACNALSGNSNEAVLTPSKLLVVVASDMSYSTNTFPRPDTNYVRKLCDIVSKPGGTLTFFGIGNPTDQSGIRCTLLPIPNIQNDLTMSNQVEQVENIKRLKDANEKEINVFLKKVQASVISDTSRQMQTDLNGCLSKIDVLLAEPQYCHYKQFVFIVSDGIQSINKKDRPAQHDFTSKNFNLCLCGWKTKLPEAPILTQFESPEGFLEFINQ